ncbi:MAG: UDP-N-acetylmuramoyl-L-alanyl-D-glutamate--2,6-diaminopimelate ligase [Chloroflexales bacterium]|nr:UDP-N-acetylmuramoyl-L-alanyl-D-glutamate--2,6-diaminopimelate ligase [Chloroflexales bacterium]
MQLRNLLLTLPTARIYGPDDVSIQNLAYDSRQVQPGDLFVAIKGFHTDGHAYIPQAIERGAAAVVVDERYWANDQQAPPLAADRSPFVVVSDSRVALAALAAARYEYPGRRLGVVGVTGTKGKSTTTDLVSRVLEGGGYCTGMISTVDFKVAARRWPNKTRQSTPEALEVQALLHEMLEAGCDYAVLEATSHALSASWNRLGHCDFDVAVFLNLSHEHLDFHGTFEQYRRDKSRLFEMLGEGLNREEATVQPSLVTPRRAKVAIVNADDPNHRFFLDAAPKQARRLTYAIAAPADVRAQDITATPNGTALQVTTPWGESPLRLHMPGGFNVLNALAALSVALTQDVPLERAIAALEQIDGIRGRMERIDAGQPFSVIVDYAHSPASFEQVLGMLRPLTQGRLIAVFGSAGERDRTKRPLQGAIAARYCDFLVLTDEDPRGEDRMVIITEIAAGVEQAGKSIKRDYLPIPDRAAAIRTALAAARPGDLVLLLGKGHEGNIIYADHTLHWDEMAEARAALREIGYG